MAEQQMITSIEFPTWEQLSNPVKSLLTFFMEGASVFFRKVTVEENGVERSFPCGVIAGDLRTINYMYAWGYDHTGYNRWDANMSCELFPAIKCISVDHSIENDSIDSYFGLPYNYESTLLECESEFNIYFADFSVGNTHSDSIIKTCDITPLSHIPVIIKPLIINESSKEIINESSNIELKYDLKFEDVYGDDDIQSDELNLIKAHINTSKIRFNPEYQLRTEDFTIMKWPINIDGFYGEHWYEWSDNNVEPTYISMYYKIGICPLDNAWNNCFWKFTDWNTPTSFGPTKDENYHLTLNELKAYLKTVNFKINFIHEETPSVNACCLSLAKDNDETGIDEAFSIVSYPRIFRLEESWQFNHDGNGRFQLKTKYILPIYKDTSDDYKDSQLVGFCYLKAFKSKNHEEVTENDLNYGSAEYAHGIHDDYVYSYEDDPYAGNPDYPNRIWNTDPFVAEINELENS